MRTTILPVVAALACASGPQLLRPVDPGQTVPGEPRAGAAASAGVRVLVRPAEASGWVVDERLTPVEVGIDNRSGQTLDLRPARFALLMPDGTRLEALTREEVRRRYGPETGNATDEVQVYRRSASAGGVYFPWADLPPAWAGVLPSSALVPSAALARETVPDGKAAAVLLLFAVPAVGLERFELEAELVDPAGGRVATIRVAFERGRPHPDVVQHPPVAAPPPPAPAG